MMPDSNSISKPSLRWLVTGSSTYYLYASVADFLAVLRSSLIWNWNERIIALVLSLMLVFAGGCSMLRGKPLPAASPSVEQERRFAGALQYLMQGKEREAQGLLEQVVAGQALPGVTDEALFRLALLHLRDEGGKGDVHTHTLLVRLKKEYPRSIWTRQAAPLTAYLAGAGALRDNQRELRTLRERNQSLTRDNKELRQSLERLKNLDLELEQKIQR